MSWKSLVCTGLLCGLVVAPAAAQSLVVESSYNQGAGVIEWEISVQQATADGTALAVELPFSLANMSSGFTASVNGGSGNANTGAETTYYYNETAAGSGTLLWNTQQDAADLEQNLGANPFSGTNDEGLVVDGTNVFAALGSDVNLPDPVPTVHIASSDGELSWTDAILAEDSAQITVSGSASSVTLADMNADGAINGLDVNPFVSVLTALASYESTFPGLDGVARADINGDGAANGLDVNPFTACVVGGGCPGVGGGAGLAAAVPEPATCLLMVLAGLLPGFARIRR